MADVDPWQVDSTSKGLDLRKDGPNRSRALVCVSRRIGNRPVAYFGLNKAAHVEAEIIRSANADKGGVTKIINIDYTDEVVEERTQDDEAARLIRSWCLPEAQEKKVVELYNTLLTSRRGKLLVLLLAGIYVEAETGRRKMERVVLSGEGYGGGLFSNHRDHHHSGVDLFFTLLINLANIFPVARRQVKHLFVASCSSGYRRNMRRYLQMFPGLLTIMSYASKSPEGRGAMARSDFEYWVSHTGREGCRRLAPIRPRPDPAHPENAALIRVATWSVRDDYLVIEDPLPTLLASIKDLEPKFMARLTGEIEPETNPGVGVVHDYFRFLTDLINREEASGVPRIESYRTQQKQAMRLRYWSKIVTGAFSEKHDKKLNAGFRAAGVEMPKFATLGRKKLAEALAQLKVVRDRDSPPAVGTKAEISEAVELLQGLYDLNEKAIPEEWLTTRQRRQRH